MKKLFLLILLIGSFNAVTVAAVNAQTTNQCNSINTEEAFLRCCEYEYTEANKTACDNYKNSGATTTTTVNECNPINTEEAFLRCCEYEYTNANEVACNNYKAPSPSSADASCKVIDTEEEFLRCCEYEFEPGYTAACDSYKGGTAGTGQAGGGTPSTFPVNSSTTSGEYKTAGSGSPELAACSAIKFKSILDYLIWIKCVINSAIIPLIFALAFLFFLWNVFRFIQSSDKTNKEQAKERMVWGIIALFVMLGVWGIIAILSNTLGISPSVPLLQTSPLENAKSTTTTTPTSTTPATKASTR